MQLRNIARSLLGFSAIGILAGCGGGGGSDEPPVVISPTPAPTPTPTPSPTPTPAATTFSVVGIGPLIGTVQIDTSGDGQFGGGDDATGTSLTGEFGRDVAIVNPNSSSGGIPSDPNYRMRALGLDATSAFTYNLMTAPAGATVISPLSTIIDAHGDENAVLNALGLLSGTQALQPQTNVLTFNPVNGLSSSDPLVAQDAARIMSINLQLLALSLIAKDTNGDPVVWGGPLDRLSQYLAEIIRDNGTARLSDKAVILAVLEKSRYGIEPPASLDDKATLLANFFSAVPSRISNEADARAWLYTFHFFVLAEMKSVAPLYANLAGISQAEIQSEAQYFKNIPEPVISNFVAGYDYYELNPNSAVPNSLTLNQCFTLPFIPSCNDIELFSGSDGMATVISATSGNPQALSVSLLPDGTMTLSRVGSFTGLTYFDYTSQSSSGDQATGRAFVRIKG